MLCCHPGVRKLWGAILALVLSIIDLLCAVGFQLCGGETRCSLQLVCLRSSIEVLHKTSCGKTYSVSLFFSPNPLPSSISLHCLLPAAHSGFTLCPISKSHAPDRYPSTLHLPLWKCCPSPAMTSALKRTNPQNLMVFIKWYLHQCRRS